MNELLSYLRELETRNPFICLAQQNDHAMSYLIEFYLPPPPLSKIKFSDTPQQIFFQVYPLKLKDLREIFLKLVPR